MTEQLTLDLPADRTPMVTLINDGCLEAMRRMADNSVDAIVTDPPYGLSNTTPAQVAETLTKWVTGDREYIPAGKGFMGADWDAFVPPVAVWDEALRVLKPGGHLLAFAGTRTMDLMTLGIRLAGFDIRDSIAWLYGSGFPKSMDVSKAIDKMDATSERRTRALEFTAYMRESGLTSATIDTLTGTNMGGHFTTAASQPAIATADLFDKLRPHLGPVPARIEELVAQRTVESQNFKAREVLGSDGRTANSSWLGTQDGKDSTWGIGEWDVTAAHSPEARQWEGWGTALKPAFEPVVVARKPIVGTVAQNVLTHGTGALNIDACRVDGAIPVVPQPILRGPSGHMGSSAGRNGELSRSEGRFPANVMLDESQAAALDQQSGTSKSPGTYTRATVVENHVYGVSNARPVQHGRGDEGGASRFFYVAKAGKRERPVVDGVAHATVKPLALMRQLVRLVTPPGGVVLEPFAGSGTTLEACVLEGFDVIGVERDPRYLPLIQERLRRNG